MRTTLFVFDVDGTVTDLQTKTVRQPEVFKIFSSILDRGDILAFNTGRCISWMMERIYSPFISYLTRSLSPEENKKLFIVGEKGTSWVSFTADGTQHRACDTSMVLPVSIIRDIEKLASQYPESMFFDDSKEVIVSVEMNDGMSVDLYTGQQQKLLTEIRELLISHNLDTTFRVFPSRIAIDVEHTSVGKRLGAERCLDLITRNNLIFSSSVVCGDMAVDLEIGQWFCDRIIPVKFVFVGNQSEIKPSQYPFPIIVTKSPFDAGFVEYFRCFTSEKTEERKK
jgi:hypothetical protein